MTNKGSNGGPLYRSRFWECFRYELISGIVLARHELTLDVFYHVWRVASERFPLSLIRQNGIDELYHTNAPGKYPLYVTNIANGMLPVRLLDKEAQATLTDFTLLAASLCSGWPVFYVLALVATLRGRDETIGEEDDEASWDHEMKLYKRFFEPSMTEQEPTSAVRALVAAVESCSSVATFRACFHASQANLLTLHGMQSRSLFGEGVCPPGSFSGWFDLMSDTPFQLCIDAKSELMSNRLKNIGVWPECPRLAGLLEQMAQQYRYNIIQPGCRVLDIGANIGICTLTLAMAGYRVAAFEPLPSNVAKLEASVRLNNFKVRRWGGTDLTLDSVTVFHGALGAERGNGSIAFETTNSGSPELFGEGQAQCDGRDDWVCQQEKVKVETIDDLLDMLVYPRESICMVKIDAQGSELAILRGAMKTLYAQKIKSVYFEWRPGGYVQNEGDNPLSPLWILYNAGYRLYGQDKWFEATHERDRTWNVESTWVEFGPHQFNNVLEQRGDILAVAKLVNAHGGYMG